MSVLIRKMLISDRNEVISMMHDFYSSSAVSTNGSKEIFNANFNNCINDNPFLEGFMFVSDGIIAGYAIISKGYSTEFGKTCIWFEDLFLKNNFRGKGIIREFFKYIESNYKNVLYKLEVENENQHAVYVYKKAGFKVLPYIVMKK